MAIIHSKSLQSVASNENIRKGDAPPKVITNTESSEWQTKLNFWLEKSAAKNQNHSDASLALNEVLDAMSPTKSPMRHLTFPIASSPQQPSILSDHGYSVGKVIGQGSFSKVRIATHVLTSKQVVIISNDRHFHI